ncbi:MAG: gluconolactonase [Fibrobacteres bacterium]|nr:gluconolactonase [Fibrobacterota bacterium]
MRPLVSDFYRLPVIPFRTLLFRVLPVLLPLLGPTSPRAQDYGYAQGDVPAFIAAAGAKVLPVLIKHPETGKALGLCDGVAADAEGDVYVSEPGAHSIYKVNPQGQASVFYSGHGDSPNGLEFDNQGRLTACLNGAIVRFRPDGSRDTVAASGGGIDFKSLDDITIGSDGSMFVSNLASGKTVFHVSADGKTVKADATVAAPDGVEWLEEKKILYVSDREAHTTWQFDVAADGSLANKRGYVTDIPGAGGITMDEREDVYLSGYTQGAVHLYSPGKKDPFLGHILVKGSPTPNGNNANQCFGGTDGKTLYITGNGGLFRIQLNLKGRKRPGSVGTIRFSPVIFNRGIHAYAYPFADPIDPSLRYTLSGRRLEGSGKRAILPVPLALAPALGYPARK